MLKQTYFEQIPLDLAKSRVRDFTRKNEIAPNIHLSPREPVFTQRMTGIADGPRRSFHMETSEVSGDGLKYPDWQRLLREATLELDKDKLRERVEAAEFAIFTRQQAIAGTSNHEEERIAMRDGMTTLRVLKKEFLGFPDWEQP